MGREENIQLNYIEKENHLCFLINVSTGEKLAQLYQSSRGLCVARKRISVFPFDERVPRSI